MSTAIEFRVTDPTASYTTEPGDGTQNAASDSYTAANTFDPIGYPVTQVDFLVSDNPVTVAFKASDDTDFGDDMKLGTGHTRLDFQNSRITSIRVKNANAGNTANYQFTAYGGGDTDLYDVRPLRDAFERFASGATLAFIDSDGTKIDDYQYGQRVEVQVSTDGGSTYTTRFAGTALDATRTTRDGLPIVEVPIVGYNHFLTREGIVKDYLSTAKSSILNDVITNFTPINWVAGNVDVQDDASIDLSVRGETPDEVIARVAAASADEEWFVNQDFEFVFQQQDSARAPAVTDEDVIDYDLPREGERAINKFSVYYGSNLGNVWTEEDREAQQALKDELNAPRRVVVGDSDSYPEVSTEDEAKEIAKRRLGNQAVIQTGTIGLPLGRFDTDSGDVFELTLSDAGISQTDFRVAQIDYDWIKGRTEMTVVENAANNVEELLIALSDSLSNARMRNADPNATETLALTVRSGVTVSLSATLTTKTATSSTALYNQATYNQSTYNGGVASSSTSATESAKVTRAFLNFIRDLWQDGNSSFIDLTHVSVGTDDSPATVADNSLEAAVSPRVAVEKFGAGDNAEKLEFVATVPAGGTYADAADLAEFGIADASTGGNHYARVTFADTTIDATTRLKVHLEATIDVDPNEQGVITSKGQERIRDLVIGESGHEPSDLVYGTGTTAAAESDTALGNQQHTDAIDSTEDGATGIARLIERTTDMEANTTNWSEIGADNSSNELLQRVVFEAYGEDVVLEAILGMRASNV